MDVFFQAPSEKMGQDKQRLICSFPEGKDTQPLHRLNNVLIRAEVGTLDSLFNDSPVVILHLYEVIILNQQPNELLVEIH